MLIYIIKSEDKEHGDEFALFNYIRSSYLQRYLKKCKLTSSLEVMNLIMPVHVISWYLVNIRCFAYWTLLTVGESNAV